MAAMARPSGKPGRDCPRCPRLVAFRKDWRAREPGWFNAPVPSFGPIDARLLIVGLAPGLQGANRTGRPFTGDYAGDLLYRTLLDYGFATGNYLARPDDGLALRDAWIAAAVRCAPPDNRPTPPEFATCRPFLAREIAALENLRVVLALGALAFRSVLEALARNGVTVPRPTPNFAHGARVDLGRVTLLGSYHVSRQNTNTGRLTPAMFDAVLRRIRREMGERRTRIS